MDADAMKTLLDDKVDKITVKLADLSVDQLGALKTAENEGGKRSTLLAAIDKQIEAAGEKQADDQKQSDLTGEMDRLLTGMAELGYPQGAGPQNESDVGRVLFWVGGLVKERGELFTSAEVDAKLAELTDALKSQGNETLVVLVSGLQERGLLADGLGDAGDPVKVALDAIDEGRKLLDLRDKDHRDVVSKLEAKANAKPSGAAKTKAGKVLSIDGKAAPFKLGELTGAKILFVDDEDRTIPAINPLEFSRSAFNPPGNRAVLARDVDFQADMPAAQVMGAFLMAGDKPVARATLVQPFSVGGGRRARMPKGTLSFAGNSPTLATAKS